MEAYQEVVQRVLTRGASQQNRADGGTISLFHTGVDLLQSDGISFGDPA
jgi:thymidylate synthase